MTLAAPEHVLPTLERDGSRHWIQPRVSKGRFLSRRRPLAWLLMALFFFLPFVRGEPPFFGVAGRPLFLLDILHRKFTLFGFTFLPTDTFLLALAMLFVFVSIFLFTAAFGRIWCGWACPQTVYLEFLYRPLQRLFEGTAGRGGPAKKSGVGRKIGYFFAALFVTTIPAHTFLAYFVGAENLGIWIRQSPLQHPVSFLVMAAVTALMFFDFYWFREQLCLIACPYGRFQSGLLDRQSLIVTYDRKRGEPRGRKTVHLPVSSEAPAAGFGAHGDCVDCGLCVATCPTGIDIRDGLQMECVNCTQCIDACDAVMEKISQPPGLIRYSSQAAMEAASASAGAGAKVTPGKVRFRTVFYPAILLVIAVTWVVVFTSSKSADVTVLRNSGSPYSILGDGAGARVANPLKLKITNRTNRAAVYTYALVDFPRGRVESAENPVTVAAGGSQTVSFLIETSPGEFSMGKCEVWLRVTDGRGFSDRVFVKLLGPMSESPPHWSEP